MQVDCPCPGASDLPDRFVGQGTRAGNDPYFSGLVNVTGHDPDFAFPGSDDARTIRSDQTGGRMGQPVLDLRHVAHRDALGDGNDKRNLGIDRPRMESAAKEAEREIAATLAPSFSTAS